MSNLWQNNVQPKPCTGGIFERENKMAAAIR